MTLHRCRIVRIGRRLVCANAWWLFKADGSLRA